MPGALTVRLSCGHSETVQTNRLATGTYTVPHSTVVPETTLHFAVVRSCHSRPASFRFRFQYARSVRPASNHLLRSVERNHDGFLERKTEAFRIDTIPSHKAGGKIRLEKLQQKAATDLPQFVAIAP